MDVTVLPVLGLDPETLFASLVVCIHFCTEEWAAPISA